LHDKSNMGSLLRGELGFWILTQPLASCLTALCFSFLARLTSFLKHAETYSREVLQKHEWLQWAYHFGLAT